MNKFIIQISIILFFNACHRPCNEPDYNFSVTESFFPEQDSINVGDTLFLTSIIPKAETDINTRMIIDFSSLGNLGDNLVISDISKFNTQRDAADSFSYFNVHGKIYSSQYGAKQLTFEETDSAHFLKVGLIALKKGLYILTVPDIPGVYRTGHVKCGRGNFEILNSNVDKHLYLFENMWGQLSNYDSLHSYCIKVK